MRKVFFIATALINDLILYRIDHTDFIEVRAPKLSLFLVTTRGFFSILGTHETFKEVKRIHELVENQDNIEITQYDFEHGYVQKKL